MRHPAGARELASRSFEQRPIVSVPALENGAHRLELVRRRPRDGRDGSALAAPVPLDRPREAVVELDPRLPAEQLARLLDVRDPQLDIGVAERGEDDLAGAAA